MKKLKEILSITASQYKGAAILMSIILILSALVGIKDYRGSNVLNVMVSGLDSIQSIPTPKVVDTFTIHINTISAKELPTHPLVEDTLSYKIIRARVRYGGFVCMNQMCAIMPKDSTVLRSLTPFIVFETNELVRYDINSDEAKLLAQHPYINKLFAENILEYRNANGRIKDYQELKKIKYFPKSKEKYLKYYINFD